MTNMYMWKCQMETTTRKGTLKIKKRNPFLY